VVEWWSGGVVVVESWSILGYVSGIPWLLAYGTVGGTHGLHPGLWRSTWICSGFSRPDGQAAPYGGLNSRCLSVLSSIVTWILRIRLVKEQAEPKVVATMANLTARVKAWWVMAASVPIFSISVIFAA
jgi:hypothetical protein